MDWEAFCLEQADDCDERGDEIVDPDLKAEWHQMAQDWRIAASRPERGAGESGKN